MTPITNNLQERAMLVTLSISQWNAVKNDKRVNREVAQKHGSDENMGRYNKSLVSKAALETIKKIAGSARTEHYLRTLPWRDGGDRILSSAGYFAYAKKMREFVYDFSRAVDEFCEPSTYQGFVDAARLALNGLWEPSDYPSVSEIRSKFALTFDVSPLPTGNDFRVNLGDSEVSKIRQEIESASNEAIARAMSDVWNRLQSVVTRMSERMKAYTENGAGKVANPFRDSLVTNITELLDLIPSLNLTDNPDVTRFSSEIRAELTRFSPDQLRESESLRKDIATRADEILARMASFVA